MFFLEFTPNKRAGEAASSIEIKIFLRQSTVLEASRGVGAQSVTVKPTGYGFDPHSRR